MRKPLVPALAALSMLFALPAFAETYTGVIDSFDMEDSILILEEEMEFLIPEDVDLPELESGTTVTVEFEDTGDALMATKVTLAE